MKKQYLLLLLPIFFMTYTTKAQTSENTINKGLGFGFQLNQYQKDFGLGLNITSPYFAADHIAFRMRGNVMFHEHIQESAYTWTPYSNLSLGIVGVGGYIQESIRLYGEGGVITLLPDESFSSEDLEFGGYGLFGFEFFMEDFINYFIEIGGMGTGAKADKVEFQPIYSNGLTVSVGFRFSL